MKKTVIIISVVCFLLSGCSKDIKGIEEFAIVQKLGIDITDNGLFEVSIKIYNEQTPGGTGSNSSSQSSESEKSNKENNILVYGNTIFEAFDNASFAIGRQPYFSHCEVIILGEKLSKKGLYLISDLLSKNRDFRTSTNIYTAKGKAKEYVFFESSVVSPSLQPEITLEAGSRSGNIDSVSLYEMIKKIKDDSEDLFLPSLNVLTSPEQEDKGTVDGTAYFKEDKLIGYLNRKETRGLKFIRNDIDMATLFFNIPEYASVSVTVRNSDTDIKSYLKDGIPHFDIYINNECSIPEIVSAEPTDKLNDMQKEIITQHINNHIKDEICDAIQKSFEDGSDIFMFTKIFLFQNFDEYKNLGVEILRDITYDIHIKTKIKGSFAVED